jgi:N-acetylglutamate synthase
MNPTIRTFEVDDYAAVRALWQRCADEGIVLRDVDDRAHIARYLARNPGLSFVAELRGAIVGAVLCGTDGRRGYLQHLAVEPACRRSAIGRALAECAFGALRREGIDKCHLMVLPENARARAFWSALGWTERGDVLLMSRSESSRDA